jgi:hypothetical protein
MVEQGGPWPAAGAPPPGWRPPSMARTPSGLFPGGPTRPTYREPHPVGAGGLLAGLAAGLLWLAMFGMLGSDLFGYAWWTLIAAVAAWTAAAVLAFVGDRGVAVGVALSAGIGWAIAAGFVAARWISTTDWPMW